jgi:antirestriction protein ArdC
MSYKPLTEDERARRRQADREQAAKAVEALRSTTGWQAWLATRRHFHRYSLANQLLIAMQCPDATRVASFRAWLNLGYCVRKGSHALRIWVPMPPTKRAIEAWEAAGADPADRPRTHFKLGPVFDRSQVEALPAPAQPAPLDPPISPVDGDDLAWAFPALISLARDLGVTVRMESMADAQGGYYAPATRVIALNERRSINHRIKTLVHELAHALLRLERDEEDLPFEYSEEELVVESIAYTVCGSIGLDTSNYSIPYLAAWSEQADLETIELAAKTIDRIAKRIEDRVLPIGV